MKIHFIPFFKRKDFDDGVKEPEEVKHFNEIGDYDNYLNCYRESMKWHHTQDQAEFHIASDKITEVVPQNNIPFDMIRLGGLKRKNIIESKTLAETHIFNEADIDGPIVSSGCDHVVNGNFNKWIDENDFDIAIPLRRKAKVNNALTKGVKGSGILGLHNIMGCKVLIIPYGGDVLGTNVDGQYFFPEALFYDYKGDRKHQYQRGYNMAKRRTIK